MIIPSTNSVPFDVTILDSNKAAENLVEDVQRTIVQLLPSGRGGKLSVAESLQIGDRTLLRRLNDRGTTYQKMLDHVRTELAICYLEKGKSAVEISELLGYSDPPNFHRAFKRWTGKSAGKFFLFD